MGDHNHGRRVTEDDGTDDMGEDMVEEDDKGG